MTVRIHEADGPDHNASTVSSGDSPGCLLAGLLAARATVLGAAAGLVASGQVPALQELGAVGTAMRAAAGLLFACVVVGLLVLPRLGRGQVS